MCKYRVILILFEFILYWELYHARQICTTPLQEDSYCVPFKDCPQMIKFVNNAEKPFSEGTKLAINKFLCKDKQAKSAEEKLVCCPSIPINLDEKGDIKLVLNASGHENIKFLPKECGLIDDEDKIIGGKNAPPLKYSWMALMIYNMGEKLVQRCGGSILTERYILTAGHCIKEATIPFVGVRVGEYSLLSDKDCLVDNPDHCLPPVQHLLPEKIIVHPRYSRSGNGIVNDIALVRVTKINLEAENAVPICLPIDDNIINLEYKSGVVTGWGRTDEYGRNVVDELQEATVEVRDMKNCVDTYSQLNLSVDSKRVLCLGGRKNIDSCQGDSGSPFQKAAAYNNASRFIQRGIVSVGYIRCGTEGYPAIYTNIDFYLHWILDNITP